MSLRRDVGAAIRSGRIAPRPTLRQPQAPDRHRSHFARRIRPAHALPASAFASRKPDPAPVPPPGQVAAPIM